MRRDGESSVCGWTCVAFVVASVVGGAAPASASDFWDEVRTPGLRAYRLTVQQADEALRRGLGAGALDLAEGAVGLLPERSEARVLRVRALAAVGRFADAAGEVRALLERDARALDGAEAGTDAALACAKAGDPELAEHVLSRMLGTMAASPQRARLYVLRGDVLSVLGPDHAADAVSAYREGLRASRGDLRARMGLLLGLRRLGETAEAAQLAADLAAQRPRLDAPLAELGGIVPPEEIAARRACALEAIGDVPGARAAWVLARTERNATFVDTQLARLSAPAPAPAASPRRRP